MRRTLHVLILTICFLAVAWAEASEKEDVKRFERFNSELAAIEQRPGASSAQSEIALARRWLRSGEILQEAGRLGEAEIYAARVEVQLELIRAVAALGVILEKAKGIEHEVHEMELVLRVIESRRDRLLLKVHGTDLTGAFPPLGGK